MKTCSKCKRLKSPSEFSKCSDTQDKLQRWCIVCMKSHQKEKYVLNLEANREQGRRRYWENPEKARARGKVYREAFPEKVSEVYSRWVRNNPAYRQEYNKRRYEADPGYRLVILFRNRIRGALKTGKAAKSSHTKELLGCPVVWLEVHLESLFKPGMTWANHGPVWHIDHIKPCAKFNLTDPEQQRICFHWTNLQPLFAKDNMSKGAKYNG